MPNPIEYGWFKDHLLETIYGDRDIFNAVHYRFSEMGYLMSAMLETALVKGDTATIVAVKDAFDKNVLAVDFSKEVRTDWSIEGKVAIQLYDITHDLKYKEFADREYELLKNRETSDGILYIADRKCNYVDGVGIFNPFLVMYSERFDVPEAYKLAVRQIDLWCKHGVDLETGVPCMEYSLSYPYEKHRDANWGRGCTWFALGLLYINKSDLSPQTLQLVNKFDDTIKAIWERDHQFTQFLGVTDFDGRRIDIDLSATLPLIYYLHKENIITLEKKQLLFYSQYMEDKIMWHSSGGSFYPGGFNVNFGSSQRLSQAFMLKLINEVK